jgi:hypothetical protein
MWKQLNRSVSLVLALALLLGDPLWASGAAEALSRLRGLSASSITDTEHFDALQSQALSPRGDVPFRSSNPLRSKQTFQVLRTAKHLLDEQKDLVRQFYVPTFWELPYYAQLMNVSIRPLLKAFGRVAYGSKAYNLIWTALTLNHNLLQYSQIRNRYDTLTNEAKRKDLETILRYIQYSSVLLKGGTTKGKEIINRRTYEGRNVPIHQWVVSKLKTLPKVLRGEKVIGAQLAIGDGTSSLDLVNHAHDEKIDNMELHASDKALRFYEVDGLDSRHTLIFNEDGQLLQAAPLSPSDEKLWIRWTLADYLPFWKRWVIETIFRWKAGILIGKKESPVDIPSLENQFRDLRGKNPPSTTPQIRPIELLNPRVKIYAEKHPIVPGNTAAPQLDLGQEDIFHLSAGLQNLDFILVEGLLMRNGEYFDDRTIRERLADLGGRLAEGGYLFVGVVGQLKEPSHVFLNIYQRRGD